jgi:hypothetical protein
MIAPAGKSTPRPTISRRFEFSRFQDQTLSSAYEVLIPVVSRRPECAPRRRDDPEVSTGTQRSARRLAEGA